MKILVCGDRDWSDRDLILKTLYLFKDSGVVWIHGAAKGADRIAGEVLTMWGEEVQAFPALWNKHGKAAGPIRNQQMLDEKPDRIIAFHDDLENSKGTRDMVERAKRSGMTAIMVVSHPK